MYHIKKYFAYHHNENKQNNNLIFEQIIWRTLEPTKNRLNIGTVEWFEISHKQALNLLKEFEGYSFQEILYHFESPIIEIFHRQLNKKFQIKDYEYDLRKIYVNLDYIKKILVNKSKYYIEIRFIFIQGRLDIGFKNLFVSI